MPTVFENNVIDFNYKGRELELALWDTAGQEEYRNLRSLSYSSTDVILICFSVDRPESLQSVYSWAEEVKQHCPGVPVVLVANKDGGIAIIITFHDITNLNSNFKSDFN